MNADRFKQLWSRNVSAVPGSWEAARAYDYLLNLYSQPGRHYHDPSHIDQCLAWLDRYADQVRDPDAIELAIWFHDACYLPQPQGHEERSAQLFRRMVGEGMKPERREQIMRLIGFTTHCDVPHTEEEALLVDIDLASFSRPWHQYVIDTARCRAERKRIDDLEFCACQIGFLRQMVARPQFYYSKPFRIHHEQDARANINRMLALLEERQARLEARCAAAQPNKPARGCYGP